MGGNAIDSAIATMYCNTVVNSQSMGIGGGFIMTVFLGNGTKLSMIARETAPAAASKDMYHGDANLTHYGLVNFYHTQNSIMTTCAQVPWPPVCLGLWLAPGSSSRGWAAPPCPGCSSSSPQWTCALRASLSTTTLISRYL